jgi:DGQHR domain-containing protein
MVKRKKKILRSPAVRARVFGVNVYRGFANLADLADASRADIYDQKTNPEGTQRDLSAKHARDAYEYAKTRDLGFWPEVFLCARRKDVVTFYPVSPELPDLGRLEIDLARVKKSGPMAISRVDGNHRLEYGNGKQSGYSRISKLISFCMAYDLSREEEIQLFKDINDNQKRMNTSHLDRIQVQLTSEEELKHRNPELYIAQRLGHDSSSPFHGRVFEGGAKLVGVDVPLRGLKTGIEYMLSRSTQLPHLEDAEAQYRVIRNYFKAVKKWQPKPWRSPKEYIMLRGSGLWAICFIGAQVMDRTLLQGEYKASSMLAILRSGKNWDWGKKGDFKGLGGRAGALEISKRVTRKLQDAGGMSTKKLFDRIMSENGES